MRIPSQTNPHIGTARGGPRCPLRRRTNDRCHRKKSRANLRASHVASAPLQRGSFAPRTRNPRIPVRWLPVQGNRRPTPRVLRNRAHAHRTHLPEASRPIPSTSRRKSESHAPALVRSNSCDESRSRRKTFPARAVSDGIGVRHFEPSLL